MAGIFLSRSVVLGLNGLLYNSTAAVVQNSTEYCCTIVQQYSLHRSQSQAIYFPVCFFVSTNMCLSLYPDNI